MSDGSGVGVVAAAAASQTATGAGSASAASSPTVTVTFDDLMKFVEAMGHKAEKHIVADAKAEAGKVWAVVKADLAKLVPSRGFVAGGVLGVVTPHVPSLLSMLLKVVGL